MKKVLAMILFAASLFALSACNSGNSGRTNPGDTNAGLPSATYNQLETTWPAGNPHVGDAPAPDFDKGAIQESVEIDNGVDRPLRLSVKDATHDDFKAYVAELKSKGFSFSQVNVSSVEDLEFNIMGSANWAGSNGTTYVSINCIQEGSILGNDWDGATMRIFYYEGKPSTWP